MECFCEHHALHEWKRERAMGGDPIWCNEWGCNLDINETPFSEEIG